ncbi:hypothetical protein [Rappaport israeli]|uniref:hypothetical protein n=1 Tax=Rappaport israeli TaxID=1839807 RepID=UPI000B197392|nr:hypothetical protein [Rappaport israeli]
MSDQKIKAFTFGDERVVVNGIELVHYFQCMHNGQYYELPYSIERTPNTFTRCSICAAHYSSKPIS